MRQRTESTSVVNRIRSDSNRSQSVQQAELDEDAEFINHGVEAQARTAQLPPVMSKAVDEHPLCGIVFQEDCIITSCSEGKCTWCLSAPILLPGGTKVLTLLNRAHSHLESASRSQCEPARLE